MITMTPARDLKPGDVFSTDGGTVQSAYVLWDGRVSVEVWIDASGGISKHAVLDGAHPCPIYTPA